MTLPEKIQYALTKGHLNFMEARKIFRLFEERERADMELMDDSKNRYSKKIIELTSNDIVKILDHSSLSMAEKLAKANKSIES